MPHIIFQKIIFETKETITKILRYQLEGRPFDTYANPCNAMQIQNYIKWERCCKQLCIQKTKMVDNYKMIDETEWTGRSSIFQNKTALFHVPLVHRGNHPPRDIKTQLTSSWFAVRILLRISCLHQHDNIK